MRAIQTSTGSPQDPAGRPAGPRPAAATTSTGGRRATAASKRSPDSRSHRPHFASHGQSVVKPRQPTQRKQVRRHRRQPPQRLPAAAGRRRHRVNAGSPVGGRGRGGRGAGCELGGEGVQGGADIGPQPRSPGLSRSGSPRGLVCVHSMARTLQCAHNTAYTIALDSSAAATPFPRPRGPSPPTAARALVCAI
jgi:hypothetical protein